MGSNSNTHTKYTYGVTAAVQDGVKCVIVQTEWTDTICQKGRKRAVGCVRGLLEVEIVKPNLLDIGPATAFSLLPKPCHQIDLDQVQGWHIAKGES